MAAHKGETITAGELHAGHIGTLIRFREFDPGAEVATITTAELRQLSHDGTGTHVVFGLGAERETTLAHDQTLTLRPPADYTDVPGLMAYDQATVA